MVQKCISKSHLESKGNQKIFVMLHLAIKLLKSSTFYLCIICTNVKSSLVTNEGNSVIRIFTYDLTTPICSKIFNFINFVSGLDVDQFFGDPTILPCNYNKSPFVAKDHDHILTRNLRIIKKWKIIYLTRLKNIFLWFKAMHTFLVQWKGYAWRISLRVELSSAKGSKA